LNVSLRAWYGFQRDIIGTKYQPTAQPGVKSRSFALKNRAFLFERYV